MPGMTLRVGERCSIYGHGRDAIDVSSDVIVTTARLLVQWDGAYIGIQITRQKHLLHTDMQLLS
jgi:hypothetical protein